VLIDHDHVVSPATELRREVHRCGHGDQHASAFGLRRPDHLVEVTITGHQYGPST